MPPNANGYGMHKLADLGSIELVQNHHSHITNYAADSLHSQDLYFMEDHNKL